MADEQSQPIKKFCPSCGKELVLGGKYCPYCRAEVMAENVSKPVDFEEQLIEKAGRRAFELSEQARLERIKAKQVVREEKKKNAETPKRGGFFSHG